MKTMLMLILLCISLNLWAKDNKKSGGEAEIYKMKNHSVSTFHVNFATVQLTWDQLCKEKMLKGFNFSKHYSNLFSTIYLNRDVSKIKEMSKRYAKKFKKECKEKGHFDFPIQSCFNECHKFYPEKTNRILPWNSEKFPTTMNTLCTATCASLDKDIISKQNLIADLLDTPEVRPYVCSDNGVQINQRKRGSIKEVETLSNETQKVLKKSLDR